MQILSHMIRNACQLCWWDETATNRRDLVSHSGRFALTLNLFEKTRFAVLLQL